MEKRIRENRRFGDLGRNRFLKKTRLVLTKHAVKYVDKYLATSLENGASDIITFNEILPRAEHVDMVKWAEDNKIFVIFGSGAIYTNQTSVKYLEGSRIYMDSKATKIYRKLTTKGVTHGN